MRRFEVWREDETRDDGAVVEAVDAGSAAERRSERCFSSWDYPTEIDLMVAEEGSAEATLYRVAVEAIPSFYATEVRDRKPRPRP